MTDQTPDTARTLEQQLADLVRKHGLDALSLHINASGCLYVALHRDGTCAQSSSYRNETFANAFTTALAELDSRPTLTPIQGLAA